MIAVIKNLWLVQVAIVVPCYIIILNHYRGHPRMRHIRLLSTSWMILTGVDVYTVIIEGYSPVAIKSLFMLVAFVLGDMTLLKMLFQILRNRESKTDKSR